MNMTHEFAQIVVGLPVEGPFDYRIPRALLGRVTVGSRVQVMFNRRKRTGFVVKLLRESEFERLNVILSVLDCQPALSPEMLQLTKKMSTFYGCSWGEAIEACLPKVLRGMKKNDAKWDSHLSGVKGDCPISLLYDPKGDKRWTFLLKRVQETLERQQQVIVLVPDIYCVELVVSRLQEFCQTANVVVLPRKLKTKEELDLWNCLRSSEVDVFVGTRSAVFAPMPNLGLIVVDEEEHFAYKQEQSPYHHVRDVVSLRHEIEGCSVIFSSMVPSLEVRHLSEVHQWKTTVLSQDQEGAVVRLVDLTNYNPRKSSRISFPLQNLLKEYFDQKKKVCLIVEPKDFEMWTDEAQGKVIPAKVQKIENELCRFYPEQRIVFYEKDSRRFPAQASLVISTSVILRHKDIARFDLIAVMNTEGPLNYLDYRAGFKMFAFLVHLRQMAKETLVLQTQMPDYYGIAALQKGNFDFFYQEEMKIRKDLFLPPFVFMVSIQIRGKEEERVNRVGEDLWNILEEDIPQDMVLEPLQLNQSLKLPEPYRCTTMLKGQDVEKMLGLIRASLSRVKRKSKVKISLNVNP